MEQVVFFYPDKRKGVSKMLRQMFAEFEEWAKAQSAREVCLGVTSGIAGDGYEKLIEKVGYRRAGPIFKRSSVVVAEVQRYESRSRSRL